MKRAPVKSIYCTRYKLPMPIFALDYIEDSQQAGLVEQLWEGGSAEGTNFVRAVISALNNVTRRLTACK